MYFLRAFDTSCQIVSKKVVLIFTPTNHLGVRFSTPKANTVYSESLLILIFISLPVRLHFPHISGYISFCGGELPFSV